MQPVKNDHILRCIWIFPIFLSIIFFLPVEHFDFGLIRNVLIIDIKVTFLFYS